MNRIKIGPLALASSDVKTTSTVSPFENVKKLASPSEACSVFVPIHYERNYSYPLIVWLHSDGESSRQIEQIMPLTSMRNYLGVSPQAVLGDNRRGYFWQQSRGHIKQARQSIEAAIDQASLKYNVCANRIFLGGYGAGGTMAYRIAFQRPELFAGVISINGPLPTGQNPLARWMDCRDLPLFWAHMRNSPTFSEERLCEQLKSLHVSGFSVTLRQYPGGDHLLDTTFNDLDNWIMSTIDTSVGT